MLIYKREMKQNSKGLVLWSIIMGGMLVMLMAFYPEMVKNQENYEALLGNMEGILKAFGIGQLQLDNILNYYALEGYLTVTLFGSIYAVLLAASILSKEQSEKTVEFLLSKPVTRTSVVVQKFLALLTNIFIFNVILTIVNIVMFNIYEEKALAYDLIFWISFAPLMLQLTLASLGFLISIFIKKSRTATYGGLGIVFVFYIINIVSGLSEKLKVLKHFTPFEYVNSSYILEEGTIKNSYLLVMVCVILLSILISLILYKRKNITI